MAAWNSSLRGGNNSDQRRWLALCFGPVIIQMPVMVEDQDHSSFFRNCSEHFKMPIELPEWQALWPPQHRSPKLHPQIELGSSWNSNLKSKEFLKQLYELVRNIVSWCIVLYPPMMWT